MTSGHTMLKFFGKFRHLRAEEFIDLLDGLGLGTERGAHVERCSDCRTTLAAITELRQDISNVEIIDAEAADAAVANADWLELGSSVRDRLLSRSVKRSSILGRWTGWTPAPAPSWSLALMILVSAMTAAGLWHYQTVHLTDETTDSSLTEVIDLSLPDSGFEFDLFAEDSEAVEAEALAWSQTEIFTTLNELEVGEEAVLRELIALAVAEDSIFEPSVQ